MGLAGWLKGCPAGSIAFIFYPKTVKNDRKSLATFSEKSGHVARKSGQKSDFLVMIFQKWTKMTIYGQKSGHRDHFLEKKWSEKIDKKYLKKVILGHFWPIFGHFGAFLGYFSGFVTTFGQMTTFFLKYV